MPIRSTCPACGSPGFSPFYEMLSVPVQSSVVVATREEALAFPTGDVVLAVCAACGFVGNAAFDPDHRVPAGAYEDQQGFSPTFTAYATQLARGLIDRYALHGKRVVEVGCGKGDFLALVCEMGGNDGIGIDPLFTVDRIPASAAGRITAVPEAFSPRHARYRPDVLMCRHTLEHIHEPGKFLRTVRATLEVGADTAVVFEVPDVDRIFDEGAFWDVYYEHCSYFGPGSLERAFRTAGFDVVDVQREYGGQYLVMHALPAAGTGGGPAVGEGAHETVYRAREFATVAGDRIDGWKRRLRTRAGCTTAVWGSGSKCVAFVAALAVADDVACVVDINPYRQNRYVPGIGRPVVAPEQLRRERPDRIIVMNPIYEREIREMVRGMGLDAEIVSV